jgi:hypothetical protein
VTEGVETVNVCVCVCVYTGVWTQGGGGGVAIFNTSWEMYGYNVLNVFTSF